MKKPHPLRNRMINENPTIFVGGFGPFLGECEIEKYFSKFGEILKVILKRDIEKGINKGYAFVKFSDPQAVTDILKESHMLDNRHIDVAMAHSGQKKDQDMTY